MTTRFFSRVMPGVVFTIAFAASGACGDAIEDGAFDWSSPSGDDSYDREVLGDCMTPTTLEVASRLHSCQKLSYSALGAMLTDRGVKLSAKGTPDTAGELYASGQDALGIPKPDSRLGESSFHTTAAATRLFDIFLQAAPEIIANIGDPVMAPACTLNGVNSPMFDPNTGACVRESVSCLLGRPAEADDMTLCDLVLSKADPNSTTDKTNKQRIAVALVLSAGHTCE